ncbi:hypothetical protein, partial [Pseudomonas aeruginosa]
GPPGDDGRVSGGGGGPPPPAKPWDGAEGLEWSIPSPAPYHTFSTPPEVK